MAYLPTLIGLAGLHIMMAMLPGPNTVVVTWYAATRSRGESLRVAAGVVIASLAWVTLALWGIGALLLEAGSLYRALRIAGAAYLVFVGIRMLRAGLAGTATGPVAPQRRLARGPFAMGMLTTLSNPKSAVFWTSAFLVAVPAHAPGWVYGAILGIVAVQSTLWYGALALFFSTGFAKRIYARLTRPLDVLAGSVMLLLGLKLADEIRREIAVRAAA